MTKWEWLATLATSWSLFGLIWIVQLVHYPSFRYVPDFTDFHPHHTASITIIVAPLMVAELAISGWLAYRSGFQWTFVVPLAIVLLIWIATFFRAVPLHEGLASVRDDTVIEALIRINWWRTVGWTLKAVWLSVLFVLAD